MIIYNNYNKNKSMINDYVILYIVVKRNVNEKSL